MGSRAGSIRGLSIDGREFPVAADADATSNLGGFTNEVQPNGDGSVRVIQTATAWMLQNLGVVLDPQRGDQEFLQEKVDAGELSDVTVTYADLSTYEGRGTLVDAIERSTQSGTASISLAGEGQLTRQ